MRASSLSNDRGVRKGHVGCPTGMSKEESVLVIGIRDGGRGGDTIRPLSSLVTTRYTFLSALS
jgi:hypothetical protein